MNTTASHPATKPAKLRMTPLERRTSLALALLFASRMLGLFLLTPVFALAAQSLPRGDDAFRVGLALGAYGLTQALLQIPLGMASDRYGRRPVILAGLLLFIVGGVVCALAESVDGVTVGRVLQGLGAVSAAITAWLADATRPEVRTRAMAMVGGSIGLSFALSLVLSPVLVGAYGLSGLFWAISGLGFACLLIAAVVPAPPAGAPAMSVATPRTVLADTALLRLNFGVFCLHAALVALFLVVPGLLARLGGYAAADLWRVYLPVIGLSFVFMVPAVFYTETRRRHGTMLALAVGGLVAVLAVMPLTGDSMAALVAALVAFFVCFNILEALQPSLVSTTAPASHRGLALGLYNTAQSLGVFAGGALGGLLAGHRPATVFLAAAVLTAAWLLVVVTGLPRRPPKV